MAWKNNDATMNGYVSVAGVKYDIQDGAVSPEPEGEALSYFKNAPEWNVVAEPAKVEMAPAPKKKAVAKKKA